MRLEDLLQERFGFPGFRPGQREVVQHVCEGRDALVVMPTGAGKSLCYQVPALARGGTTVVVSPLIALMKDQVDALVERGIRATYLNSSLSNADYAQRVDALRAGAVELLYVAPERFSPAFIELLGGVDVRLFAIDEAHCLSQWGHDFRPDYLRLGEVRRALGDPPTLALTATATPEVQRDIVSTLDIGKGRVFVRGFDRENLILEVLQTSGLAHKDALLPELVHAGPALVYAATRKHVERATRALRESGVRAGFYHAGLNSEDRSRVQEDFMRGHIPVVVATNAFGMGIDKADIRTIVHYDLPGTLEAYYQEIGRAGRDGRMSRAVLLFRKGDRRVQEFFIDNSHPPAAWIHAVYDRLVDTGENPVSLSMEEIARALPPDAGPRAVAACLVHLQREGVVRRGVSGDRSAERRPVVELLVPDQPLRLDEEAMLARRAREYGKLDDMVRYTGADCRRRYVIEYFGETAPFDLCGTCDQCRRGGRVSNGPSRLSPGQDEVVRMALAVVARMEHHVGKKGFSSDLIAKVAVGSRDAAVLQWGFDSLSTYGLLGPRGNAGRRAPGKAWTVGEVADLLSALVDARALDEALVSREIQGKLRTYKEIATNELGRGVMLQRIQDFQMVFPHAGKLEVVAAAAGLQEDLVAELRDLRRTLAERENVPAYVVFSNATLEELASFRPTTRRALETVRGMGPVRADRFGAPILEAIRAWNLRGS